MRGRNVICLLLFKLINTTDFKILPLMKYLELFILYEIDVTIGKNEWKEALSYCSNHIRSSSGGGIIDDL